MQSIQKYDKNLLNFQKNSTLLLQLNNYLNITQALVQWLCVQRGAVTFAFFLKMTVPSANAMVVFSISTQDLIGSKKCFRWRISRTLHYFEWLPCGTFLHKQNLQLRALAREPSKGLRIHTSVWKWNGWLWIGMYSIQLDE